VHLGGSNQLNRTERDKEGRGAGADSAGVGRAQGGGEGQGVQVLPVPCVGSVCSTQCSGCQPCVAHEQHV
jgi:hypothetical protein